MASSKEVVAEVEKQVEPIVTEVSSLKIETNDHYVRAGEILAEIKKAEKVVKTRKEEITKPLNAALKSARDLFRDSETKIGKAKTDILGAMGTFKRKQDAIAAEKARKLEEKIAKGTIKNPETIMRNIDKIEKADNVGAGVTETTRKVVDVDWEKLDRDYAAEVLKRPSVAQAFMVEVRKDALGNKAQGVAPREIAGVTVTDEKVIY